MIGAVIITLYNNKTYRIDEVDFEATPLSTFPQTRKGQTTNVKYVDYFAEVSTEAKKLYLYFGTPSYLFRWT